MLYVIDGIFYTEYPDAEERTAALRDDRDEWKRLAEQLQKRVWQLEMATQPRRQHGSE